MKLDNIGETIRKHRERLGLTQIYVAKAIGISREQYLKIEKGKAQPKLEEISRLSAVFKVSPEELLQAEIRDSVISNLNAVQIKDMIRTMFTEVKTELLEPRIEDVKAEIIELLQTTRKEDMYKVLKYIRQLRNNNIDS
jgi:transcriptional regulator with XRE-family HTH domain